VENKDKAAIVEEALELREELMGREYQDLIIAASFHRVFASRGPTIEHAYVRNIETSPYGTLHGLRGFTGLVRYWMTYRALTDATFAALPWPKVALDTTEGPGTPTSSARWTSSACRPPLGLTRGSRQI